MIKIAMIGAGSVVFSRNLTGDILSCPELRDARIVYMDIDRNRVDVAAALCRRLAAARGATPEIVATLDRRTALDGADFVINMVQIGGLDATRIDFEIPRKYGLNFTIADTTGPGGLFRALRTYPMLTGLCRDMAELCPRALLLNYSNPMSMNMRTIFHAGGPRAVGLCHSVQGTFEHLMHYLGEDPAQVSFICAGINHMAFYLKLEKAGVDLYPRLFAAMQRPQVYDTNRVRFELMRRLGYFVTESSEHNAEYCPYFMAHGNEMIERLNIPVDEYLRRCDAIIEEFDRLQHLAGQEGPLPGGRSHEYGSTIISAMVTGQPAVVYGNMPNGGTISNLPPDAIAEAPTLVDRNGPAFTAVGPLPAQLAAYVTPHVWQHQLFIEGATRGRRDSIYQAAMFDPLTAARLPLDRIVQMCDEMIAAHGDQLPPLNAPTLVPSSGVEFGRADVGLLARQWNQRRAASKRQYLRDWLVIGPFAGDTPGKISLDFSTAVDRDFAGRGDGSIDKSATYAAASDHGGGAKLPRRAWVAAQADDCGMVSLGRAIGQADWSVAYAYAEFDSPRPRRVTLRCASDDGIRVALNGKIVHSNDVSRSLRPDSDAFSVDLSAGRNRLFVKITNHTGDWGFGVAVPGEGD
jgi:alpha-galactosidase